MYDKYEDEYWMYFALKLAKLAKKTNEIPVGAVLIHNNTIIGKGYNQSIKLHDSSAHAEILALRQGGQFLKNYRLLNTTLYVTLEPCIMCTGMIIHSRITRLVYSVSNNKNIIDKQFLNLINNPSINHKIQFKSGVLRSECKKIINSFFSKLRKKK